MLSTMYAKVYRICSTNKKHWRGVLKRRLSSIKKLETLFNEVEIISSDEIRAELLGDVNDQTQNDKVFAEVKRRAIEAIKNYKNVIIDATNVTIKDRASVLSYFDAVKSFRKNYMVTAHVMTTPLENCKIQNTNREKKVPAEVIIKQLYKYEIPFYEEGFDCIVLDGYTLQEKYDFSSYLKILNMMKMI